MSNKHAVKLIEYDDENKDSENFTDSAIVSEQHLVGDGLHLNDSLRKVILNDDDKDADLVIDVGGNKTTPLFLEALKSTRMYRKVDLYIIPMSGGSQDFKNAIKTFDAIKSIDPDAKIIFSLGRVRNIDNINFQYSEFFRHETLSKCPYFALVEDDVIDLSRRLKKTVFEISEDTVIKKNLEDAFDEALTSGNNALIEEMSKTLEIYDDAGVYVNDVLIPTFDVINENLTDGEKSVIVIANSKGGASKSTTAVQSACANSLHKSKNNSKKVKK